MTREDYIEYLTLKEAGYSQNEACTMLGIPRSTMYDYIKREEEFEQYCEDGPKILFFDIESAPDLSVGFGRFNVNHGQDSIIGEGGYFLTAAWKWADSSTIHTSHISDPAERWYGDDSEVVMDLYDAFEAADIVVAHNLKRFDLPMLKARLAYHNLPPLKTVKLVDTLQIAKQLRFNSNKLDSLAAYLGIGRKTQHTGIKLWVDVMRGDQDALDLMLGYNQQDVNLLESVYYRLRQFDTKHPNVKHYYTGDEPRCPVCGSEDVEETGNSVYTQVSKFSEIECGNCGHKSRTRTVLNSKENRASILLSTKA